MEFDIEDFVVDPAWGKLDACTKENLKLVADRFDIVISKHGKKQVIRDQLGSALLETGVLSAVGGGVTSPKVEESFSDQVKLKELELELRRLDVKEKEIDCNLQVRMLEEETKRVVRLKELEVNASGSQQVLHMSSGRSADFDVSKYIRLVPVFCEDDVDKYFILFERVATTLKWPVNVWTLLLQCVLTGNAQEVFSRLKLVF